MFFSSNPSSSSGVKSRDRQEARSLRRFAFLERLAV